MKLNNPISRVVKAYNNRKVEALGQIQLSHDIGKWLTVLSSLSSTKTIVEIGTWSGAGSSAAIAKAVLNNPNSEIAVYGYEVNKRMSEQSTKRLSKYPFYQVIYGSIVTVDELEVEELNGDEHSWLEMDKKWISDAPYVKNTIPSEIDLCLLDGGEFSTYPEWKLLEERITNWVVLDDIHVRKNRRVLKEALESGRWILVDKSDERNGTAVIKRINY